SGTVIDPRIVVYAHDTLTIGPNLTLRGAVNFDETSAATVINQGTISVDHPVASLSDPSLPDWILGFFGDVAPQFTNEGTLQVRNGATLIIDGGGDGSRTNLVNKGTFGVTGSSVLDLKVGTWSSPLTTVDAGSTVNISVAVLVTDPGQTSVLSGSGNW